MRQRHTSSSPPPAVAGLPDEEQRYGKIYDARVVRRLWPFMLPYTIPLSLSILCLLGTICSQLAAPYLVKLAVDRFIAQGDLVGLWRLLWLYLGNAMAGWLLQYAGALCIARVAQGVLFDLRRALFGHFMRLDLGFYDRQAVGSLMSRVQNDVGALQELFTGGLLNTLGDLLILGGIVVVMWSMHPTLTLITCTVLPPIILLTAYWRTRSRRAFQQVRATLARVNARLQESIAGVRVIQSLLGEAHNLLRFTEVNSAHLEANLYAARIAAWFFPVMEGCSIGAIALVIGCGGPLVLAGSLSAGGLVAFVLYMYRFFEPIRDLSFRWNALQMAMAAGERILDLLATPVQVLEPVAPVILTRWRGEVQCHQVGFHYHVEVPVLRELSLHIAPGQMVALVGPTGAGKTTLIHLLMRYYDVTAGAILIDGVDIRQLALEPLRRQIGLVLQEPFLFSGTVRDNLRYGNPQATEADMVAAARRLGVHERICQMAHGYDTPVHERGALLSHGQRQLISLVRALLAAPRILLLDEATASLDSETERLIQQGLRTLLSGRTALVIAHRLSTVQVADRIVVLAGGQLVEDGTHAELLRQGGLYARLYAKSSVTLSEGNGSALLP